jgi:hypothetical protein
MHAPPIMRYAAPFGVMVLMWLMPISVLYGQEADRPTPEECETLLGEEDGGTQQGTQDELADLLARCDGVLRPQQPAVDSDMVIPPPDTGTTPVIPPDNLPTNPTTAE